MRYQTNDASIRSSGVHAYNASAPSSKGNVGLASRMTPVQAQNGGQSNAAVQQEERQDANLDSQQRISDDDEDKEYKILYMEIERISQVLRSKSPEPHEKISLTSTFNKDAEILPSMHEKIMRLIKAMVPNATTQQKDAFIRDLFDMGIRIGRSSGVRSEVQFDSHMVNVEPTSAGENTNKEPSRRFGSDPQNLDLPVKKVESMDELDDEVNSMIEKFEENGSESPSIYNQATNSSDAVDHRWERLRDKALNSNTTIVTSKTNSSSTEPEPSFINDCIEAEMESSRAPSALNCCHPKQMNGERHIIHQQMNLDTANETEKEKHKNDANVSFSMIADNMKQCKMETDGTSAKPKRPGQPDDTSGHQPIHQRYVTSDSFEIDRTSNSIVGNSTVDNSIGDSMQARTAPSFDEGSLAVYPKIDVTVHSSSDAGSSLRDSIHSLQSRSGEGSNATESISYSDIIMQDDSKMAMDMAVSEEEEVASEAENPEEDNTTTASCHNLTRLIHVKSSLTIGTDFPTPRKGIEFDDKSSAPTPTPTLRASEVPNKREYSFFQSVNLSVGETMGKSLNKEYSDSKIELSPPSWRLSPSESLSDFELQVLSAETGETTSYFVHKHMMAVGPRSSEYMNEVFAAEDTSTFEVTLDEKTAALIPNILDFVYSDGTDINISTDTAVPLRQLGKMLKIMPLELKASSFILQDIEVINLPQYVSDCCFFNDEDVTKVVVDTCCENIATITTTDRLWILIEPELFLQIISSPHVDRTALSKHLSILVKEYLELHRYEVNADIFSKLTSKEIIPIIDRNAAMPLIELCQSYDFTDCESLQRRCAYTVACYWNDTPKTERQRLFSLLRNLPSSLTVDFLEIVESGNGASEELRKEMEQQSIDRAMKELSTPDPITLEVFCGRSTGEGQKKQNLTWRLDAKESYSDWDLHIKYLNHQEVQVYHVHKHILAVGRDKGDFFSRQFNSKDGSTGERGCTTIVLDCEAASVFPQVLDFMYSRGHEIEISNENAVPLHYVARVLGISTLTERAIEFIGNSLSLTNVIDYIIDAGYYKDDKTMALATRLCAQNILSIGVDSEILKDLEADFFENVISCDEVDEEAKCHVNVLITKYFSIHNLDGVVAEKMLKSVDVSKIDKFSALNLLQMLSALNDYEGVETFEVLKKNCALVITEHWSDLTSESAQRKEMFSIFPSLSSDLLTCMFESVDARHRLEYDESMALHNQSVHQYRQQAEETSRLREQEVLHLKRELEIRTAKMLSLQKALEGKLNQVDRALDHRSARNTATVTSMPNQCSDDKSSEMAKDESSTEVPPIREDGMVVTSQSENSANVVEEDQQSCAGHQSVCTAKVEAKKGILGCCGGTS